MTLLTLAAIWNTLAAVAACLSLPGSIELLVLSVAALMPARRGTRAPEPVAWRTAVVVPAHNEETGIAACVQSLLACEPPAEGIATEIFVIADNCTDSTAALAAAAGARVLERTDPERRGKGYALHYAFSRMLAEGFDCALVIDADTFVAPNFLAAASAALRAGEQAVQARYLLRNTKETTRSRLMGLAIRAFNVVRPLGRERLGLSCASSAMASGSGARPWLRSPTWLPRSSRISSTTLPWCAPGAASPFSTTPASMQRSRSARPTSRASAPVGRAAGCAWWRPRRRRSSGMCSPAGCAAWSHWWSCCCCLLPSTSRCWRLQPRPRCCRCASSA